MGLSEPRKRIKLAHDPRNLQWSDNTSSFGARIMQSSGWKPGTALGATSIPAHEASAAKVKIAVKDDMLGLGASLKSKNVEHQRTGLDAFQGLLGRLNARDEGDLKRVEEKIENRKLAMFAQGRWGGMVFVPGGLLVQDDKSETLPKQKAKNDEAVEEQIASDSGESDRAQKLEKKRKRDGETPDERIQRKAEKKQRKEERRTRREAKRLKKLQKGSGTSTPATDTVELTETSTGASTPVQLPEVNVSSVTQESLRNGRHILRGRNIQAKRLAFSDSKGLDQIFMRQQQQAAA